MVVPDGLKTGALVTVGVLICLGVMWWLRDLRSALMTLLPVTLVMRLVTHTLESCRIPAGDMLTVSILLLVWQWKRAKNWLLGFSHRTLAVALSAVLFVVLVSWEPLDNATARIFHKGYIVPAVQRVLLSVQRALQPAVPPVARPEALCDSPQTVPSPCEPFVVPQRQSSADPGEATGVDTPQDAFPQDACPNEAEQRGPVEPGRRHMLIAQASRLGR
jgi:hypothetical protein